MLACLHARVSSTARAADRREGRFLDRDDHTAWITARGQTQGTWIEFDVPEGIAVRALRWVHGARGPTDRVPLARAVRVRVSRDGAPVGAGEFVLDPARNDAQVLPIDGPAGLWRIEVLATDAPSDAGASALTVADLQLHGVPVEGANTISCESLADVGAAPRDGHFRGVFGSPVPSLDVWCTRFLGQLSARVADGGASAPSLDASATDAGADRGCAFGENAGATGGTLGIQALSAGPFVATTWVTTWTPRQPIAACRLAVQTARGWSVSEPVGHCMEDEAERMSYVTELLGARVTTPDAGPPQLEVHYFVSEGHVLYGDHDPSEDDTVGGAYLLRCGLSPNGGVRCAVPHLSVLRPNYIPLPELRDGG